MQGSPDIANRISVTEAVPVARTAIRHALILAGLFVLLSAIYWAAVLLAAGGPGMPLDDSYIHLQYARALQEGRLFEYNAGVRSTGTSAPLWTAMLPLTHLLTRDWLAASYLLGVLWTIACVGLTYYLALRWTGRPSWALFAGVMLLLANPTVISAYGGMEVSAYVAIFLLGLLLYDFSRTASSGRQMYCRLAGSAVFAIGIWLRPEFLLMPMLIAFERIVSLRRMGGGWLGRWIGEMAMHGIVWLAILVPYMAFNKWAAGTLLPNTYTIKAVARNSTKEVQLMAGLPAAWVHRDWRAVQRLILEWLPLMVLATVLGQLVNNAVLTWQLPRAIWRSWRGQLIGPAGLLAGISLIAFPLVRVLVDPIGMFPFQFQRYFGHLTVLMVLLGAAVLAMRKGSTGPSRRLMIGSVVAGVVGLAATTWFPVMAVRNINQMQVRIGKWIDENTPADAVIATNDVGAVAFYGHRRIIDTVGLTEPELAKWYMAGGNLEGYLKIRKPTYACLFPNWHDGLANREDLFEPLLKVRLRDNVICGGKTMMLLRTCWDDKFNANWSDKAKQAKARRVRVKPAADDAAARTRKDTRTEIAQGQ